MKVHRWQIGLALGLMLLTAISYYIRWVLFPGAQLHNEMWRFLVGDMAFMFLQILLVTVFIDGVIQKREKDEMRQKLNMIVGAFFSQTGTRLLGRIAVTDEALAEVRADLVPNSSWKPADYRRAKSDFDAHQARIDIGACDLHELKAMLDADKPYLLNLLGNDALLEHEQFTDLLWAVTHLAEELDARRSLEGLSAPDEAHLEVDTKRVYVLLGKLWLDYLAHLQGAYPHLFSLAARTNPLDPGAHAEID